MVKINKLNNRKIEISKIENICRYFISDCTASEVAKKLDISRQTINKYYKDIRVLLLNKYPLDTKLDKDCFTLKYIYLNEEVFYYIQYNNKYYFLDSKDLYYKNLFNFIKQNIENTLINHKKANSVKLLYNKRKNDFLVIGYYKSSNNFETFLNQRLKKFRGINKNSYESHIKESFIRFNNDENFLFNFIVKNIYI